MDASDSTTFKRCPKCGEWKSRDDFHKNSTRRDGLASHCKTCNAVRRKAYYEANKDALNAKAKAIRESDPESDRQRRREYYAANPEKHLQYRTKYRTENRDSLLERRRTKYAQNREMERLRTRNWRKNNPDRARQSIQRYAKSEHGRLMDKARQQNRRARVRDLPSEFTTQDWIACVDYFGGCCAVCGRQPGLWHTLASDHWIPLNSRECPGTVPYNIVPLCHGDGGCNNSKQDRPPSEWLIAKFGKRNGGAILKRIEAYLESRK